MSRCCDAYSELKNLGRGIDDCVRTHSRPLGEGSLVPSVRCFGLTTSRRYLLDYTLRGFVICHAAYGRCDNVEGVIYEQTVEEDLYKRDPPGARLVAIRLAV